MKYILILSAIICALFFLRAYIERMNLYVPDRTIEATPDVQGVDYEELFLETKDGIRINAWSFKSDEARSTLLYCHGNAGNISHRIDKIEMLRSIGLNVFIFDYRGYGKSEGTPSEKGFYRDAEAAYLYLTNNRKINPEDIVIYGESLGGSVGLHLADKNKAKALITENTFTSVKDMGKVIYPFLPHFFFSDKFNSVKMITTSNIPKLIMHSENDEVVPFQLGERLFAAAAGQKMFLKMKGGHGTAYFDSKDVYMNGIADFLNNL